MLFVGIYEFLKPTVILINTVSTFRYSDFTSQSNDVIQHNLKFNITLLHHKINSS